MFGTHLDRPIRLHDNFTFTFPPSESVQIIDYRPKSILDNRIQWQMLTVTLLNLLEGGRGRARKFRIEEIK
jgi:hypothetical protein